MENKRAIGSVRINGKNAFYLNKILIKQIKEDIRIVQFLKKSLDFHKSVIPRTKSTETLKNRSSILLCQTVLCVTSPCLI